MSFFKKLFSRNKNADWQDFARSHAARLQEQLGGEAEITPGALEDARLLLRFADGQEMSLSLYNRVQQWRQGAAPEEILAYDVATVRQAQVRLSGHAQAPTPESILPVVKHRDWAANIEGLAADDPQRGHIVVPLVGDLILTYVADSEESMHFLKKDDLAALGLADRVALGELAVDNFARRFFDQLTSECDAQGIHRFHLDNIYEASLFVLMGFIGPRMGFTGQSVMAIPARNYFLLCDSADDAAVAALFARVQEIVRSEAHPISALLYLHEGDLRFSTLGVTG